MALKYDYDVVVVGGGVAGTMAAIACAQEGKSTLLVEQNQFLGGTGTGGMVSELLGVARDGKLIYGGATQAVFDKMIENGDAAYNFQIPMSSNPNIKVDRLRCNPECLKLLLEKSCLDAGVSLLYTGTCTGAVEQENGVRLTVKTLYEQFEMNGKFVIDATGNANLAHMMGYPTLKAPKEALQVCSLIIRLGGIDLERLQQSILSGEQQALIREGMDKGILKGKIMAFAPIPNSHEATMNVTRTNVDHENALEVTRGLCETHSQIPQILSFIREKVPGCENAVLSSIASNLGVRDARRIEGEYVLTGADLLDLKSFDDSIAVGTYPLDVHDPVTKTVLWQDVPGVYKIPARSMMPKRSKRLIVAGRGISATEQAFAAIRVMPIAMNIGEAAGCMVATLLDCGGTLPELDIAALHDRMKKRGMKY